MYFTVCTLLTRYISLLIMTKLVRQLIKTTNLSAISISFESPDDFRAEKSGILRMLFWASDVMTTLKDLSC